jgi:hypothetical protein
MGIHASRSRPARRSNDRSIAGEARELRPNRVHMRRALAVLGLAAVLSSSAATARADDEATEDRRWSFDVEGLAGARSLSVSAFDQALRASGYGPMPRIFGGGGLLGSASFERWRLELAVLFTTAGAASRVDPGQVAMDVGDARLSLGYDLVRIGGLTVFALGGVGLSALMIDARDPHWSWLATRAQVPSGTGMVEQDSLVWSLEGGIEQRIPLGALPNGRGQWSLVFALRGGYLRQFTDGQWMTSDSGSTPLGGLPRIDVSGEWLAFTAGFGLDGGSLRAKR